MWSSARLALSPSLSDRAASLPALVYLRFCPRVYVNHCSDAAVCVLYIRRRMYLHDNIIPFLAYVDWLFFFVIDCPTGCFTSTSQKRVTSAATIIRLATPRFYYDYHNRHYKAYLAVGGYRANNLARDDGE